MTEDKIRERVDQALAMSEKYQERCHSAEKILADLVHLPWWKFGAKKRLRKKFEEHYHKFVAVSFKEFIEKQ